MTADDSELFGYEMPPDTDEPHQRPGNSEQPSSRHPDRDHGDDADDEARAHSSTIDADVGPATVSGTPDHDDARGSSGHTMRTDAELEALRGESWDRALPILRSHFPDSRDGILFCVFKLLQDRHASIRDFRDEAQTRGVKLSGRSLHSAKVLLGLAERSVHRKRQTHTVTKKPAAEVDEFEGGDFEGGEFEGGGFEDGDAEAATSHTPAPAPAPRQRRSHQSTARTASAMATPSVADALRDAVQQIQTAAREEADRLRDAMREAITVLQNALDEE